MPDEVFLARNGQQLGPYTHVQLRAMAQRGEVAPDDFAWHADLSDWQPATDVLKSLGISVGRDLSPPLPSRTATASRAAAAPMSHREMYEAFLGPKKSGYYIPMFEQFDAGHDAAWWNALAGLFTQLWMIHKGMYLWTFLWYPLLSYIAWMLISTMLTLAAGLAGWVLAVAVQVVGTIVVWGLYSNKIYHGHALKMIERSGQLGLSEQQRREWLSRKGAGSSIFWLLVVSTLAAACIVMVPIVVLPAIQNYEIREQDNAAREQALEGAGLAQDAKAAVTEYYSQSNGRLPADNAAAGLPPPDRQQSHDTMQVEVVNGAVKVTFGMGVNSRLAGRVLAYTPEQAAGGQLLWRCGWSEAMVRDEYLPPECRK